MNNLNRLLTLCLTLVLVAIASPSYAQELAYYAVDPCRIVDTRKTTMGNPLMAGESRNFSVHNEHLGGPSIGVFPSQAISGQGGNPGGCESPEGQPSAVHINVTAVPVSGAQGNLRVWPHDGTEPTASLVNYKLGTNIANAAIIKTDTENNGFCIPFRLCFTPDITVKSNFATAHVVIDILGYFYPVGCCSS